MRRKSVNYLFFIYERYHPTKKMAKLSQIFISKIPCFSVNIKKAEYGTEIYINEYAKSLQEITVREDI